jgi:hypothetical protein
MYVCFQVQNWWKSSVFQSFCWAWMPDGIFSYQKSKFGGILECLVVKDAGKFYGHLVYFTAIWYILWPSGILYGHLVYFFPFWYVEPRKIWQPCCWSQTFENISKALTWMQLLQVTVCLLALFSIKKFSLAPLRACNDYVELWKNEELSSGHYFAQTLIPQSLLLQPHLLWT